MHVSVKKKEGKSVSLFRLSDMRHSSGFAPTDLSSIMTHVSQTYLQQANLELNAHSSLIDVSVNKRDLGNPLFPENAQIRKLILDATPNSAKTADILVYGCWNVEVIGRRHAGGVFIPGTKTCWVENLGRGPRDPTQGLVFAHEVGHALGLDHNQVIQNLMRLVSKICG